MATSPAHAFSSPQGPVTPPSSSVQSSPIPIHEARMTRAQQSISLALLASSLYLALFLELIPLPPVVQTEIVPVLPFWVLVSFGAMLLFRLGWGVLTFNDTKDAFTELMLEVDLAKADLRNMGVTVD